MTKKIIALLLAVALLMGLAGCAGQAEDPTTPTQKPTEPTEAPPTDPPGPDMSHWESGIASLGEAKNLQYTSESSSTMTVGGAEFSESGKYEFNWTDISGEAPVANVQGSWKYNDQTVEEFFAYANETAYLELDGAKFKSSSTVEEFEEIFYPAVLLDETLYETITVGVTGSKAVYTFADPTAPESWTGLEAEQLVEASGTATVENGMISSLTYNYTFTRGAAHWSSTITVTDFNSQPAETAAAPQGEDWLEIEDLLAPQLLKTGYMAMVAAVPKTTQSNWEVAIGAAATAIVEKMDFNSYGESSSYMASNKITQQYVDMTDGTTEEMEYEEAYRDGRLSYGYDGELEDAGAVGASIISGLYDNALTEFALQLAELESITMEYAAGCLVLEFTGNEQAGINMEKKLSENYLGDPDLIDNAADKYETETLEGYLAIDMDTFLPTAYGVSFQGTHLFGTEYANIAMEHSISIRLPSREAYKNITDEELPMEEPEEKATPVLYQVTDDKGATLWLFGTIHVGDERTSFLPQELYDAFDASDALAVEFDDEAFSQQIEEDEELMAQLAEAYYYSDGTTAADHLDETVYEDAVLSMKAAGSYNAYTDYLKPSLWSNDISNFFLRQDYSLDSDNGMDRRLMERAREQEKEIMDVESGLEQIQMMTGYSDKLQEFLLMTTIYSSRTGSNESTRELFEMWCRGDEAELIEYLNEEDEEDFPELTEEEKADMTEEEIELYEKCRSLHAEVKDEYEKAMLSDRNFKMLDVAKGYLASGDTVFYAVGLAHLLGPDGLVDLLRAEGYTVELVTYAG